MIQNFTQKDIVYTTKLEERVVFFFVYVGIVTVTYGFFMLIDFLPEKPETTPIEEVTKIAEHTQSVPKETTAPVASVKEEISASEKLPVSITFDSLNDKEVRILNPKSDSVSTLDTALLSGVVRHPDSADFTNTGTILLLGHSSYLPKVNNKNYQAFNGIQKLVWGDTIRLRSETKEYVYSVNRVYQAKATDAEVSITYGEPKLVLSTCNSFGTKDDRFVVEATLTSTRTL